MVVSAASETSAEQVAEILQTLSTVPNTSALDTLPRNLAKYWVWSRDSIAVAILEKKHKWVPVKKQRDAKLVWTKNRHVEAFLPSTTIVNYINHTAKIASKGTFVEYLREYKKNTGKDYEWFHPKTYLMYERDDCLEFKYYALNRFKDGDLWISKETLAAEGRGITIYSNQQQLQQLFSKEKCPFPRPKRLIQQYIHNPLLLNERKSEMRLYFFIANVDPLLVLAHEGTVRLTLSPYKLKNFDDPTIHITNTHQQKTNQALYDKYRDTMKWDWPQLEKYLIGQNKTTDTNFLANSLKPILFKVLCHVMNATRSGLGIIQNRFQLLGIDVIPSNDLKTIWVTEMQTGPSLELDHPVKMHNIPKMVDEMLAIAVEIDTKRAARKPFANLDSVKQWEWVINEAHSPPFYYQ
eukprot:TRINITY_DN65380_c0_g1_i1.p1 TRINITY_DN65380_c0_g1~~TRINITY_DN65380_c0_g1_i1.p1  ORF type:complete len:472 (-),score=34.62 TRINITY_DN65380_c0_g1_i1:25-1248(-)